jgi:DNA-directed RNA polymerase specialized sigma24 family protein
VALRRGGQRASGPQPCSSPPSGCPATLAGLRAPASESVELRSEAVRDARQVIDAVRRLPLRERDALTLSAWEGLTHEEIAAALDIPVGTVKSRLARARARLDPHRQRASRSRAGSALAPAVRALPTISADLALEEDLS